MSVYRFALVCVLSSAVFTAACNNKDNEEGNFKDKSTGAACDKLSGNWKLASITCGGTKIDPAGQGITMRTEFAQDGKSLITTAQLKSGCVVQSQATITAAGGRALKLTPVQEGCGQGCSGQECDGQPDAAEQWNCGMISAGGAGNGGGGMVGGGGNNNGGGAAAETLRLDAASTSMCNNAATVQDWTRE